MKKYLKFKSQYDKFPKTKVENHSAFVGYKNIANELNKTLEKNNIIALEFYPGVDKEEVKSSLINLLNVERIIDVEDLALPIEQVDQMIKRNLTDDRVFGLMSHYQIEEFYDLNKVNQTNEFINDGV